MPIPNPNPILNSAIINFNYVVSPTITKSSFVNTNTVTSQFNLASISSTKVASTSYADVGDTIVYTVTLLNSGNVTANNVLFIDTIPNGTTLVVGSFNQDTLSIVGTPNPPGVILPNPVGPGLTSTVTFSVLVTTIPIPNPIQNIASMNYRFTVNPSIPDVVSGNLNTNFANTTVSNANLNNTVKSSNKPFVTCGDIITYTVTIPNVGNVTAINVVAKDTIPNGTSLVGGSVVVNGQTQPLGTNPQTGIIVGTISAGGAATLSFQVVVVC